MLKKIIAIILSCLFVLSSCTKQAEDDNQFTVIGLNFPSYDLLRTLTKGTDIQPLMLLPLGGESHSYEPTPQDVIKLSKADLFVYTGGESDSWVNNVLSTLDEEINSFRLIDEVPHVTEAISDGMEIEEEGEIDEHVWTSLENEKILALKLAEKLAALDSRNSTLYKENAKIYVAELDSLINSYQEVINSGKRNVIVFADRFPISHFVNEFDLDFFAAFPGCATETEASAKTVAFLIDKVKSEQIPIVFHIELSNTKLADMVSAETKAEVREWNTAHNVSKEQFDSGITYLEIMRNNLSLLKEALN